MISGLFSYVLKKFFTLRTNYENKLATNPPREVAMIDAVKEIKDVVQRSRATLIEDLVGALSLVVLLIVGLNLSALV